jgi:membrane protein implicated in regulation of membrane protease activity
MDNKTVWPMVAMFLGGLAAIVAILAFVPADNAQAGVAITAILAMLGSLLGTAWISRRVDQVHRSVASVDDKVNGRMSELIARNGKEEDNGHDDH